MKKFIALSLTDVVSIMLINVKMPTIAGILTFMSIYEQDKFRAELSMQKLLEPRGQVLCTLPDQFLKAKIRASQRNRSLHRLI